MSYIVKIPLLFAVDFFGCFLLLIIFKFFFQKIFVKLANHDFSFITNIVNKFFRKKDISKTKVIKDLGLSSFAQRKTKRIETIGSICISIVTFLIFVLFILVFINQANIESKLIYGILGFFGVALGLGMQTIAKDISTGFLIVAEDQIGVGDTVEINDIKGQVAKISIRVVTIKEEKTQKIHFIPFSQVTKLANL